MSGIPQWLADITFGEILGVLVGIGALVAIWKTLGPGVKDLRNFLSDWNGEPERPGVPGRPGVMATLREHGDQIGDVKTQLEEVKAEIALTRTEVGGARTEVATLSEANTATRDALQRHLDAVPVLLAEVLDKAENTTEKLLNQAGPRQPDLFGEDPK